MTRQARRPSRNGKRLQDTVRHPLAGPIGVCCVSAAALVGVLWLVGEMATGDLDSNDKIASVAGLVVACTALLLTAVGLRLQLQERATNRRSEARADLVRCLTALHSAAGRPDFRRVSSSYADVDRVLERLGNRTYKAVLRGDSADWRTTRAVVSALIAVAETRDLHLDSELLGDERWRRRWAAADASRATTPVRPWLVGLTAALLVAGALNAALPEHSRRVIDPVVAEQLVVGKGTRRAADGELGEVRLRLALANTTDADRTIRSFQISAIFPPAACGSSGPFFVYELSTALTMTALDRDRTAFSGEVTELAAGTADSESDFGDGIRLPAHGSYSGRKCGTAEFLLGFDAVVVLPARATTTVEIRLPESVYVTRQKTKTTESRRFVGFPSFGMVEAIDSNGVAIEACRTTTQFYRSSPESNGFAACRAGM
ncbi:hypothetical protein [Actinoplanes sp. M2I2]|uniref:hypothetical protein n=1 Tax=Actinoplanes sp. M2I2 TaxID=1734444 RepID=UPI002020DB0D|nr:hypothetical protein [Actinoplanes sp. M2I2]